MFGPIKLRSRVDGASNVDLEDILPLKHAMQNLGYYRTPSYGMNPYPDEELFTGITNFQKDHDLTVDGIMKPDGETERTMNAIIKQRRNQSSKLPLLMAQASNSDSEPSSGPIGQIFGGIGDMAGNYGDMRDANTIGADKYFHCKGNCEATRRGPWGEGIATTISDSREWWDQNIKGFPPSDSAGDQRANRDGRTGAKNQPDAQCTGVCAHHRPRGLPPRY